MVKNLYELLNNNSKDIVTLHIESYAPGKDILQLFKTVGLFNYLLKSKNPNDDTLTLGELRKNNERLIVFSDYRYERDNTGYLGDEMGMYKGIFPTINYKETRYSIDDYPGCEMRTDFRANPNNKDIHLFVFNHFSPLSTMKDYNNTINKFEAIMKRVHLCLANQLLPNFIAVDYFELGECSPNCMSTKQVVFSLNIMKDDLKLHNVANLSTTPKNLPTYSHAYNVGEYILSKSAINFMIYSVSDYWMHMHIQNIADKIETIIDINSEHKKALYV